MTNSLFPPHADDTHVEHVDDVQLSMVLEGDAEESVRLHVEKCASCQERARQLAAQEAHLRTLLHRSTCPSPDELRDYAWDLLPDDEAQRVARHLGYCPYCTADYFRDYYAGDTSGEDLFTVAAAVGRHIRFHEAERVESAFADFSGVRDAARQTGQVTIFQGGEPGGEEVLLILTARADDEHAGRFVIEGTFSGIEADGSQVNLWQDERPVETVLLDPAGDFRIAGLSAGAYELILNGPTFKLRVPRVTVGIPAASAGEPGA